MTSWVSAAKPTEHRPPVLPRRQRAQVGQDVPRPRQGQHQRPSLLAIFCGAGLEACSPPPPPP